MGSKGVLGSTGHECAEMVVRISARFGRQAYFVWGQFMWWARSGAHCVEFRGVTGGAEVRAEKSVEKFMSITDELKGQYNGRGLLNCGGQ